MCMRESLNCMSGSFKEAYMKYECMNVESIYEQKWNNKSIFKIENSIATC